MNYGILIEDQANLIYHNITTLKEVPIKKYIYYKELKDRKNKKLFKSILKEVYIPYQLLKDL